MKTLILTGWGWKCYAFAAALALRVNKGADVIGVSTRRLPEILLEKNQYNKIIIVGVGLTGNVSLLEKALDKLYRKNVKIIWLSALDIPEEITPEIRSKFEPYVFYDGLEEAVCQFYNLPNEPSPEGYDLLLEAAMYFYRNYQDLSYYSKAIQHIANGDSSDRWNSDDRNIIEHYQRYGNRELAGRSKAMVELNDKINLIAPKERARVLIYGESGTGKETVALQIHNKSPRRNEAYIAFNCASINTQLLESRFLGYEKNAFTGANERKAGVFEQADGGTLFLDEIGELPLEAQGILLRVLEGGRFCRIGEKEELHVDVRLLAATNRNLAEMVRDGKFREDLFHRLNVIQLKVPSLRDHREDIAKIANDYWLKQHPERLTQEQIAPLLSYDFPGNVRELFNLLERATVLEENDFQKLLNEHIAMTLPLNKEEYPDNLEEMTRLHIRKVYAKNNQNLTKTAEALGTSRNTTRKYIGE